MIGKLQAGIDVINKISKIQKEKCKEEENLSQTVYGLRLWADEK